MARTDSDPIRDPEQLVLERARCYAYKGRYLQVTVFSKYLPEVLLLEKTYGGHHYRHGSGFYWLLSKRADLVALVEKLGEKLPSENGFEEPIISNYM